MARPRITPLAGGEWDDAVVDALSPLLPRARANPRDAGNVLGTLVHNQGLARAYLHFNAYLLRDSTLSDRMREVAVLRAVQLRGCDYLWEHHISIAERAGLEIAEIDALRAGVAPPNASDRVVVQVVDEMDQASTVCDATWAALQEHFDERQIMDLIFVIGCYQMLAVAVNALRIQPEEDGESRPR